MQVALRTFNCVRSAPPTKKTRKAIFERRFFLPETQRLHPRLYSSNQAARHLSPKRALSPTSVSRRKATMAAADEGSAESTRSTPFSSHTRASADRLAYEPRLASLSDRIATPASSCALLEVSSSAPLPEKGECQKGVAKKSVRSSFEIAVGRERWETPEGNRADDGRIQRTKARFKWLRGARASDGSIYGIPTNANKVLRLDPASGDVGTIGEDSYVGQWKWHGGVLANDGNIYGIPCNAEVVLKIVPSTCEVTTIGGPLLGGQKWYGGLLGEDGCIYGIPYNASSVLKIDPSTQEVTTIGELPEGGWKWHGGVVAPNGDIYGMPSHANTVLKIVPSTGEVVEIGTLSKGRQSDDHYKYKYGGGVVGEDGAVYGLPSDADRVLKIVPTTGEVTEIGEVLEGTNKWQNGFSGRDGAIYGIPCNAEAVLKIVPSTGEVSTVGGPFTEGIEKWEGGVVGDDGAMYCVPQQSEYVLKIDPAYPDSSELQCGCPCA
ncbi:hypothetical protein CYMTET_43254 [Cymbomonas tetramitiformis]|uniref:DUF6923 domain-containing protein n=1 Tax=Cymbomonas tetramitiformis TaxID=36881 RepID=A0AAE0F1U0_9CHLO|nr:hypothetical protein CYMTET_43254 [Cymbomonas tetramitiformis]